MKNPALTASKASSQNALLWMQDKEREAQALIIHEIREATSTVVTPSCAAAVTFGKTL
ncbi:MAG: hypothetical protein K2W97_08760 [Chthoniobacterales bacterium]|nr:hypothetical protein [Chthoniobacterales bacterium]